MEWCNRTNAVKYLFKYITKGVDKATIVIEKGPEASKHTQDSVSTKRPRDEIQEYLECRYVSACEATWRTFSFHIHQRKPAVQKLIIHLPGQHHIRYRAKDDLRKVLSKEDIERTMFTAWMEKNIESEEARQLTYLEFPTKFTWNSESKIWSERQQGGMIGRIINIHPSSGQLYYLRILINKLRGPRSFEEILTFEGKIYPDYKSACYARGLLDSDIEWHDAMDEAIRWGTPYQLRQLFVLLLIYCEVGSPLSLWNRCWKSLGEDMLNRKRKTFGFPKLQLNEYEIKQYTLMEIEKVMHQHERSLDEFKDMPKPDQTVLKELGNTLLTQELQYNVHQEKEEHSKRFSSLNVQQRKVYDAVMESVENGLGKLFFLYGPGGTGKTYLYNTIISKLRSEKKIVLPVASSGIAALLLPAGRTAHSRFKIPMNLNEDSVCHIFPGTMLSELIEKTDLIIWEEAPMTNRHAFEALDRTLRDLMSIKDPKVKDQPFGGKTVLLGGDFRQTLPIIPQGSRADAVLASIKQSHLWDFCNVFDLKQNMRVDESQESFAEWLLSVGDGAAPTNEERASNEDDGQMVEVNPKFLMQSSGNHLQDIFEATSRENILSASTKASITERAILTPRNETVDEINAYMLEKKQGISKEYLSSDSIGKADTIPTNHESLYTVEYLNSLEFSGLPKHILSLKVGVPIMLLRNINQKEGLCNGTRFIITRLGNRLIEAEIVTGTHAGKKVILPRIILSPLDSKHPFTLRRRQFPIRVCYAMTINKSQGQSLKSVMLYLPQPVFSHGQLYVALSRVTSPEGLSILKPDNDADMTVKNIVYKEIYNGLPT